MSGGSVTECNCGGTVIARGLCRRCYNAEYRAGRLTAVNPYRQSPQESFFAKVDSSGACWEWTAGLDRDGYGVFATWDPETRRPGKCFAHRWSYEYWVGKIPEGLTLDHTCRNKACVTPAHLEPVTAEENYKRYAVTELGTTGARRAACVKCGGPHKARGLCQRHYSAAHRRGEF